MKKLVSLLFIGAFGLLITDFGEICAMGRGSKSYAQSNQRNKKKTKTEKQAKKQRKKEEKARKKAKKSNGRNQNLRNSDTDDNDHGSRNETRNRRAAERAGRRRQSNLGFSDLEEDYDERGDDVDFSDLEEDSYYDEEAGKKAKKAARELRKKRVKREKASKRRDYEKNSARDRQNNAVNSLRSRKRRNSGVDDEDSYLDAGSRRNRRSRGQGSCTCPGCGSQDWKDEVPGEFEANNGRKRRRGRINNRSGSDQYEAAAKNSMPLDGGKVLPIFTKSDIPNFGSRRRQSRDSYQVYKLDSNNSDILRDELQKYRKYFSKKA